jgi:hypothetical protein
MPREKAMMTTDPSAIREHMQVLGADGQPIGPVDAVDTQAIKLTKNDPHAGGQHHWIPLAWVEAVDDAVHLNLPSREAMERWEMREPAMPGM